MVYNLYFDIAALFINIVLVLLAFFRKTPPHIKNIVFRVMLLSNLFATVFDILSSYSISFPQNFTGFENYFLSILYYLFHNWSAFLYVMYGLATDDRRLGNKKIRGVIAAGAVFVLLSIITTPFTKLVFYFDDGLVYRQGPLLYVLYALALSSVAFVLYLKLTNQETQSSFQIVTNIIYTVVLLSAFVFHIINSRVLIELFAIDLGYIVMYASMDNPEQYLYKTIRVYNRKSFDDYVHRLSGKNRTFQILIFTPKEAENYKAHFSASQSFAVEKKLITSLREKRIRDKFFVLSEFCYAIVCTDYVSEMARIDGIFEKGVSVNGKELAVNMSYAIIRYPEVATNSSDLFIIIDDLLHRINGQIGSAPLEVDPNVLLIEEKKNYERILLDALKNDSFVVEYEPVFNTKSNDALDAEAKLSIKAPDGLIPMSSELFKVAEEDGLIIDVDEVTLMRVGQFIKTSSVQKLGIQNIIVNLSIIELMNIHFINRLKQIVSKYDLPCDHICFKLIDLNMSVNADVITKNMNEIHALGFKFVVARYGENSANLSTLINLPIIGVKFGEQIMKDALKDEKHRAILLGLMKILKELEYSVALGDITTSDENELVKLMKPDFVQGTFYGKQMPDGEFITFYKRQLDSILAMLNRN